MIHLNISQVLSGCTPVFLDNQWFCGGNLPNKTSSYPAQMEQQPHDAEDSENEVEGINAVAQSVLHSSALNGPNNQMGQADIRNKSLLEFSWDFWDISEDSSSDDESWGEATNLLCLQKYKGRSFFDDQHVDLLEMGIGELSEDQLSILTTLIACQSEPTATELKNILSQLDEQRAAPIIRHFLSNLEDWNSIIDLLERLSPAVKASLLAKERDSALFIQYYRNRSFFDEQGLDLATIGRQGLSNDQLHILFKLLESRCEPTFSDLGKQLSSLDAETAATLFRDVFLNLGKWDLVLLLLQQLFPPMRAKILIQEMDRIGEMGYLLFDFYYHRTRSFLEDQELDPATKPTLSNDQWMIFFRLIESNHIKTLDELQLSAAFREVVKQYQRAGGPPRPIVFLLKKALISFERLRLSFPGPHLLNTLLFIQKNTHLMGMMGRHSKRHPGVQKIEPRTTGLPYTIAYDLRRKIAYSIRRPLGQGRYKSAKEVFNFPKRGAWSVEAISKLVIKSPYEWEEAKKEISLLKECVGMDNVIQFLGTHQYDKYKDGKKITILLIRTRLYNMGTLDKHIFQLGERDKLQVAVDLIQGVMNLHQKGIIHRDLKPQNILLDRRLRADGQEEIRATVVDLGLANKQSDKGALWLQAGTPFYMPPEVLEKTGKAGVRGDAWAVGVILSELFYQHKPFQSSISREILNMSDLCAAINQWQLVRKPSDPDSIEYVIWKLTRADPCPPKTPRDIVPLRRERIALRGALPVRGEWCALQTPPLVRRERMAPGGALPVRENTLREGRMTLPEALSIIQSRLVSCTSR